MYCSKCGTYNDDDYRYCLSCGERLSCPAESLDRKTSDGRFIIDTEESPFSSANLNTTIEDENGQQELKSSNESPVTAFTDSDKCLADKRVGVNLKESVLERKKNGLANDDVVVLNKFKPDVNSPTALRRYPSAAEIPPPLPRGFRIFIACCVVLVIWLILTAIIIPGLKLTKQGAIVQAVVMCGVLGVIKACWKSIVGDKPKSK